MTGVGVRSYVREQAPLLPPLPPQPWRSLFHGRFSFSGDSFVDPFPTTKDSKQNWDGHLSVTWCPLQGLLGHVRFSRIPREVVVFRLFFVAIGVLALRLAPTKDSHWWGQRPHKQPGVYFVNPGVTLHTEITMKQVPTKLFLDDMGVNEPRIDKLIGPVCQF